MVYQLPYHALRCKPSNTCKSTVHSLLPPRCGHANIVTSVASCTSNTVESFRSALRGINMLKASHAQILCVPCCQHPMPPSFLQCLHRKAMKQYRTLTLLAHHEHFKFLYGSLRQMIPWLFLVRYRGIMFLYAFACTRSTDSGILVSGQGCTTNNLDMPDYIHVLGTRRMFKRNTSRA